MLPTATLIAFSLRYFYALNPAKSREINPVKDFSARITARPFVAKKCFVAGKNE